MPFTDAEPALIDADSGQILSYQELSAETEALSAELAGSKSLLLLLFDISIPAVLAYLAARRAGHAVMIGDPNLRPDQMASLVERYQPELLYSRSAAPAADYSEVAGRPGLFRKTQQAEQPIHPDLALLLPTSGSTGNPKFVRLSSANIAANTVSIARSLSLGRKDRAVTSLPLAYSYGLSVLHTHLHAGGSLVLSRASVMEPGFWEILRQHEVTSLAGVPYTYRMLERVGFRSMELSNLTVLTQAGGRLDDRLVEAFHRTMAERGGRMYVMYGQTEASPRMTCLPPQSLPAKLGSVGIPLDGGQIRIRTEDGSLTAEAGGEGEVVYCGPNVMMGYSENRMDLSLGDQTGGTLNTGDVGYLDRDGYLWLTGRSKRIAKLFGTRVSLDDVEKLFERCAPVAAVAGDDSVVVHHETADPVLLRQVRIETARALRVPPSAIALVPHEEGLPTNSNGKVDYHRLVAPEKLS